MNNIDEVKQLQHETVLFSRLGNSILTSRDHRHRIWVNQMPTSMPVGTNFQEVGFLFCSRHDAISMLIFQSETSALIARFCSQSTGPAAPCNSRTQAYIRLAWKSSTSCIVS